MNKELLYPDSLPVDIVKSIALLNLKCLKCGGCIITER